MNDVIYSFPEAVLDAGAECVVEVNPAGAFRAQKLMMVGLMAEIRGFFEIKRARLPPLDHEDVIAYTAISRHGRGKTLAYRRGRTTIEYRGPDRSFVRTYLPSSVEHIPVDPLSYVSLVQIMCDGVKSMPENIYVPTVMFGAGRFGNSLSMPTSKSSFRMRLRNHGDIQVCVFATIFGVELSELKTSEV